MAFMKYFEQDQKCLVALHICSRGVLQLPCQMIRVKEQIAHLTICINVTCKAYITKAFFNIFLNVDPDVKISYIFWIPNWGYVCSWYLYCTLINKFTISLWFSQTSTWSIFTMTVVRSAWMSYMCMYTSMFADHWGSHLYWNKWMLH